MKSACRSTWTDVKDAHMTTKSLNDPYLIDV